MQLQSLNQAAQQKNARWIAIGSGTPRQAAEVAKKLDIHFPILCDPERQSYRITGMRKDFFSTFNPKAVGYLWRSLKGGNRQGSVQGAPFQQGGAMVVQTDGKLLFQFVSSAAGDNVDPEQMLAAIDS